MKRPLNKPNLIYISPLIFITFPSLSDFQCDKENPKSRNLSVRTTEYIFRNHDDPIRRSFSASPFPPIDTSNNPTRHFPLSTYITNISSTIAPIPQKPWKPIRRSPPAAATSGAKGPWPASSAPTNPNGSGAAGPSSGAGTGTSWPGESRAELVGSGRLKRRRSARTRWSP